MIMQKRLIEGWRTAGVLETGLTEFCWDLEPP